MSTQRYAVEFDHEIVGVAIRAPGGFMFISSDRRFDKLDGDVFPRSRGLARRLGEVCQADRRGRTPRRSVRRASSLALSPASSRLRWSRSLPA